MTAFFTYGICIPLGILKAIRHRTRLDNLTSVLIFIGYAIPGFALGAVLSNLLAVQWPIFPLGGFQSAGAEELPLMARAVDIVWHSVLPLIAYLVGRVRRRDDADEEQPDGEHERRLRADGARQGAALGAARFSCMRSGIR